MAKKKKTRTLTSLGNVYSRKKWALRFAKGRPVRKVNRTKDHKAGWMICRKPKKRKKSISKRVLKYKKTQKLLKLS